MKTVIILLVVSVLSGCGTGYSLSDHSVKCSKETKNKFNDRYYDCVNFYLDNIDKKGSWALREISSREKT